MKIIIEAIEKTDIENAIADVVSEEVNTTESAAIKNVMERLDIAKTYDIRRHKCRHDEHTVKPCTSENISAAEIQEAMK